MFAQMVRRAQRLPGWWRMRSLLLPHVARLHRKRLGDVTFVGITGSAGKTTAKILATAVLGTAGKIRPWAGTMNNFDHIMRVVVATKPSDDFCVIEFSAGAPGSLDRCLATVKPQIGVVTAIGTDHLKAYHSIEAIAAEKGKLIACLPTDGVAVLNADDPLVIAMADQFAGRIITFGLGDNATLRATSVRSAWPDRLSFTATYQGESVEVRSQLCGTHWTSAILAALAVGIAVGIPLEKAAKAVGSVEAYPSRMYPVTSPDGVTFIVDDWKSSLWTMNSVFDFLKVAQATKKVLVVGTLSDYGGTAGPTYARTTMAALDVADHVIFVGPMATHALRVKNQENADRLHVFSSVKGASDFLSSLVSKGDLIVVKGTVNADHLGRIAHHWIEPISCWSMTCRKNMPCTSCDELRSSRPEHARGSADELPQATAGDRKSTVSVELPLLYGPFKVLVGIGNPGNRYRNTPHNIGFEAVDALAARLGVDWATYGDVVLAHVKLESKTLLLVKPQTYVNNVGKCLKRLSDQLGFAPEDCALIQDDIHLPLGKIRSKTHGSDGGHKGVRSALVAFQTNALPRFKIGVAPNEQVGSMTEYLVTPFSTSAAETMAPAIELAVDRLVSTLELAPSPADYGNSQGRATLAPRN